MERRFSLALTSEPNFVDAIFALGYAFHVLKEYNYAIQKYLEALNFRPKDAEIWFYLGVSYQYIGEIQVMKT